MERVQCLAAKAMAYSATAVLPALVCAATNTLSPCTPRRGGVSGWTLHPLWYRSRRRDPVLRRQSRLKTVSLAAQLAV